MRSQYKEELSCFRDNFETYTLEERKKLLKDFQERWRNMKSSEEVELLP